MGRALLELGADLITHLNLLAKLGPRALIDRVEGKQTHSLIQAPKPDAS